MKLRRVYQRYFLFVCMFLIIALSCNRSSENKEVIKTTEAASPLPENDTLRLMVWENYVFDDELEVFKIDMREKYQKDIHIEVKYAESSDDFFQAVLFKEADLVTLSHHDFGDERFEYLDKGLLVSPEIDHISNYGNIIQAIEESDFHRKGELIFGIPLASGPYGLAYNSSLVDVEPDSWSVFWEPENKNNYCISEGEYIYNLNIVALAMGYERDSIHNYDYLNNEEFIAKLYEFVGNAHSMWVGVDHPKDLKGLRMGTSWGDSFNGLRELGEDWKMAKPREGTMWWVDYYCMSWALNDRPFAKKLAEEWINKSLSDDYQLNCMFRQVGIYPIISSISDQLNNSEREKLKPENYANFMETHFFQSIHSQRDRNGMRLLWEDALQNAGN